MEQTSLSRPSPITSNASADAPALAWSETLITELENSELLMILTPMHNFAVPATLKLWLDQVIRIHRSFASTPEGKIGLAASYRASVEHGWRLASGASVVVAMTALFLLVLGARGVVRAAVAANVRRSAEAGT